MNARIQLYIWMLVLTVVGLGRAAYTHWGLGFPLIPGEVTTVWTVEARITFDATGEPVLISLNQPDNTGDLVVLDSHAAAPGYGYYQSRESGEDRSIWSRSGAEGRQTVYYRTQVYRQPGALTDVVVPRAQPPEAARPELDDAQLTAAKALIKFARERSADARTFTVQLLKVLSVPAAAGNIAVLTRDATSREGKMFLMLNLLAVADVPARRVRGILLQEGQRREHFSELIEVFDGERWFSVDPETRELGRPENFLVWQSGGESLLEVNGGRHSKVVVSTRSDERAARNVADYLGKRQHEQLFDFSIYTLPVDVQNTFAYLLMIPVGALVVVILRNLVGIRTSGTFMPILIALAFMQTTLLVGIVLFLVVVGFGLMIRSYLSRLNLLLVPRISAVLIVVIVLYMLLSIVGFRMGLEGTLNVTYFPMIIIAWTIERMSVLWEEEGPREVMTQGGGSLLVAILAYLVMTNRYVEYWAFTFPELELVVLAIILFIGQYTGYRLMELRRFQPMAGG